VRSRQCDGKKKLKERGRILVANPFFRAFDFPLANKEETVNRSFGSRKLGDFSNEKAMSLNLFRKATSSTLALEFWRDSRHAHG
jgi:hypothetical protein